MTEVRGYLVLENPKNPNGIVFPGKLFGWMGKPNQDQGQGEVVFNTGMSGYQEILTDPSYKCQIICMTSPHIGNVGVNDEDAESRRSFASGFVCQEISSRVSSWRSKRSLIDELMHYRVPGISEVDTRAVTLELRSKGATRGLIIAENLASEIPQLLRSLPQFENRDLVSEVSTAEPYRFGRFEGRHHVVAVDYGVKTNLLRCLEARGCKVTVVPAKATAETILGLSPDGVFLSNGPGDPSALTYAHATVRALLGQVPIFGVCMGHQVLSSAIGAKTYKLKFGHRGANQPVQDLHSHCVEISSHNHGYSVDETTLPTDAIVSHRNLNDGTVEGISIPARRAFSVQYHPEAAPGPHDSQALFDRFVEML